MSNRADRTAQLKVLITRYGSPPVKAALGVIRDLVSRANAAHDELMRWSNPRLFLDQHEVMAHLCPVRWPGRVCGFHSSSMID